MNLSMGSDPREAPRADLTAVNPKVYNTRYQMTARTDRSGIGRYSPAYATGREFEANGNCSIVRVFDCLIAKPV